jgi:hypothetical protein
MRPWARSPGLKEKKRRKGRGLCVENREPKLLSPGYIAGWSQIFCCGEVEVSVLIGFGSSHLPQVGRESWRSKRLSLAFPPGCCGPGGISEEAGRPR